MTGSPLLRVDDLSRIYSGPAGDVIGCRHVSFVVEPGEMLVISGRSGAGKTTLLNLLVGMDRPTSGAVFVRGKNLSTANDGELTELRRHQIGFVFQSFGLLPMLSAKENVEVPLRIRHLDPDEREQRVDRALAAVGLASFARQRPDELSGGQQQRVGIARALAAAPALLLADEPTSQLDSATAADIADLLFHLVANEQMAVVVTTHQATMLTKATRTATLRDGTLIW